MTPADNTPADASGTLPSLMELQRMCDAPSPERIWAWVTRISANGGCMEDGLNQWLTAPPLDHPGAATEYILAARVIADAKERERVVDVLRALLNLHIAHHNAMEHVAARILLNDMAKEAGK